MFNYLNVPKNLNKSEPYRKILTFDSQISVSQQKGKAISTPGLNIIRIPHIKLMLLQNWGMTEEHKF